MRSHVVWTAIIVVKVRISSSSPCPPPQWLYQLKLHSLVCESDRLAKSGDLKTSIGDFRTNLTQASRSLKAKLTVQSPRDRDRSELTLMLF
ncbi:hypothetical protein BDV09DRAFT_149512 [Aspergillus tetrazonus]